ncbi:hypothetical protein PILCRDRAFT_79704, partial [Piloderma croceum F 1598]
WCEKNDFKSKLPKAVKKAEEAEATMRQGQLDSHLQEMPCKERVIPYTDALFRKAAIEWLVATDQPIQALEHPAFQKMIGIAARATNGIIIPNRKATRQEIMNMFKNQLIHLKERLNVSFYIFEPKSKS